MKKLLFIISIILTVALFFVVTNSFSTPVNGYNSYINSLPGGKDRQVENFNIIDAAENEVVASELDKRERQIKFNRPIHVERLTEKYFLIVFEVFFKPMRNSRFSAEPAIYGLLFEAKDSVGLIRYTSYFLKWIEERDIEEYKNTDNAQFCSYFRRLGLDDCIESSPKESMAENTAKETDLVKETRIVEAVEIAKVPATKGIESIGASKITSGVIKEKFIDPSIVREKDLKKEIEKNMAVLSKENDATAAKSMEMISATKDKLQSSVNKLESELAEEQVKRRALEKRISDVESMLKNQNEGDCGISILEYLSR